MTCSILEKRKRRKSKRVPTLSRLENRLRNGLKALISVRMLVMLKWIRLFKHGQKREMGLNRDFEEIDFPHFFISRSGLNDSNGFVYSHSRKVD